MSTEFTDSRGQVLAVRLSNGKGEGTRLELKVSVGEWEQHKWLISEFGELVHRHELIRQSTAIHPERI